MRVLSVFVLLAAVGGPNPCSGLLPAKDDAGAAPPVTTVAAPLAAPANPVVAPKPGQLPAPAPALPAAATGAQHLARGQQLEAQGKLDEASKEYDAAADKFRAEGNLEASVDARKKSAAAQEKLADQLLHGGVAPKPGPAPAPAPAPAPPAAGGIPNGLYLCHGNAANGAGYVVVRRIQITGGNYVLYTYNDKEKIPGTYSLGGTKITWLSGPLAGHGQGDYMADTVTKGNMVLVFIDALTPIPGAHRCYITNSAPP